MTFNPQNIIQDIRTEFGMPLEFVTGEKAQISTAYQIERGLLKSLLSLGRQLLALFFVMRAQNASRDALVLGGGQELPYHSEKERTYFSIFGKVVLKRPYFYQKGSGGQTPQDAELSLGSDRYSDLLRDMAEYLGVLSSILIWVGYGRVSSTLPYPKQTFCVCSGPAHRGVTISSQAGGYFSVRPIFVEFVPLRSTNSRALAWHFHAISHCTTKQNISSNI